MTSTIEYSIDDIVVINHKEKSDVDRIKQQILSDHETVESLKELIKTELLDIESWVKVGDSSSKGVKYFIDNKLKPMVGKYNE